MTLAHDHAVAARRAEWVFADALDSWTNGLFAFTSPFGSFPGMGTFPHFDVPYFDAAEAVELQFKFVKRVVEVNYEYARQLAEATNAVTGAVRQHIEGLTTALFEQVHSVAVVPAWSTASH